MAMPVILILLYPPKEKSRKVAEAKRSLIMKLKKRNLTDLNLDEDLLQEAAKIEEEIKNVPLEENPADKERLRAEILMNILQEEQKKKKKRSVRRKTLQWAAALVVTLVGIFGVSMTSQANRIFLVQKVEEFFSGRTTVNLDNEEDLVISDTSEQQARENIEEALGLEVPEFYYVPEGMEYLEYEVFEDVDVAKIYYSYQDNVITLNISGNEENAAVSRSIDGEIVGEVNTDKVQLEAELWELTNEVNDEKAYCAQWVYKNTYFLLSGTMELDEMQKILESMVF